MRGSCVLGDMCAFTRVCKLCWFTNDCPTGKADGTYSWWSNDWQKLQLRQQWLVEEQEQQQKAKAMGVQSLRHQEPAIMVGVQDLLCEMGRIAPVTQRMTSGQKDRTDKSMVQWKWTRSSQIWPVSNPRSTASWLTTGRPKRKAKERRDTKEKAGIQGQRRGDREELASW